MKKEILREFEVGERLDKAVALVYAQHSRASIEKLIASGDITVNGEQKPTRYKLKQGDTVEISFSHLEQPTEDITIPIIYEDEHVLVLNKPVGVLTHSKGEFNKEGTVATFLKSHVLGHDGVIPSDVEESDKIFRQVQDDTDSHMSDFWDSNRAGIVHRLDRATSGVIICAKDKETENYLKGQFSKRNVKKAYLAVIKGEMPAPEGTIDMPIERNPKKPSTFRTHANGKVAQTHFKTLANNGTYSLLELKPVTGRTHQLRVHLAHFKRPIVGDTLYDGEPAKRLMLHAKDLELTLPGGNRQTFSAPIPTLTDVS